MLENFKNELKKGYQNQQKLDDDFWQENKK